MLKENLLLVEVIEETGKNITFDFLDESEGNLYEIRWNFNRYDPDTEKWVESEEQLEKVEEWAQEHFGVPTNELKNLGGQGIRKDVYHYNRFNSLWEVQQIAKMPLERKDEIINVEIEEIKRDKTGIHVLFQEDGKRYSARFNTSKYVEAMKEWYLDPIKEQRALYQFEDTFGVPFEQREVLIGESMMVSVEVAFGKFTWLKPSKFPKHLKEEMQRKALSL